MQISTPPSPAVISLERCIEKLPKSPHDPTPRPRQDVPWAWAQSSISAQVAALAEFDERVEVGGGAGDVHGDDRPGPRRDRRLGRSDVDAQRVGVDVDEHRRGVDRQRGGRRGDERHAGNDHLVALADVAGRQRRLEGVRAVREREAVRAPW